MDEPRVEGQSSGTVTGETKTEHGPLTIRRERKGGSCLIRLYGELDLATAAALEKAVSDASASGVSAVVLDLSALCFIDASGLRSIVAADLRARCGGGSSFHLLRGPSNIDRLFRLTGLHESLPFLN
jgi:anti-sigma B factor antagonist